MEQRTGIENDAYNPYGELDDLIAQNMCGEPFRDAIHRAIDQTEGLAPHQQLARLLEVNERAINLNYELRAGVQSTILDKAMEVCDAANNPNAAWKLHVLQIRALSRDCTILTPEFYPATNLPDMRQEAINKMRRNAEAVLRIKRSGYHVDEKSSYFCGRILATYPEITPQD